MRWLKITIYSLSVLVLQTVLFPRLNLLGAGPDLVLISVVIFAVLEDRDQATLFSAANGLLQDLLSIGHLFNTVIKTIISIITSNLQEEFVGDQFTLAAGLTALFTPLALIAQALFMLGLGDAHFAPLFFLTKIFLSTLYNLILLPLLFPLLRSVVSNE